MHYNTHHSQVIILIIITGVVGCVKSIFYDYTILDSSLFSWFERISMTIILLNCVTLGMYEPCADSAACVTVRCRILEAFDHAIFVFFAAESLTPTRPPASRSAVASSKRSTTPSSSSLPPRCASRCLRWDSSASRPTSPRRGTALTCLSSSQG